VIQREPNLLYVIRAAYPRKRSASSLYRWNQNSNQCAADSYHNEQFNKREGNPADPATPTTLIEPRPVHGHQEMIITLKWLSTTWQWQNKHCLLRLK
jgi:hypothetical protein